LKQKLNLTDPLRKKVMLVVIDYSDCMTNLIVLSLGRLAERVELVERGQRLPFWISGGLERLKIEQDFPSIGQKLSNIIQFDLRKLR
jgi:hypothetical protein